jgi:FHA domain-containing protein
MSAITLDVLSLDAKPLPVAISARFEGAGGTIGRDEGNTLALPDPHRRVSRLHAAITFPDGIPTLTNSSTALPVNVGELELACGQSVSLLLGAMLEIGPYLIKVRPIAAKEASLSPATSPVYAPPAYAPPASVAPAYSAPPPYSAPVYAPPPAHGTPASDDPFADLLSASPSGSLLDFGAPALAVPLVPAPAQPAAAFAPIQAAQPPTNPVYGATTSTDDPLAGLFDPAPAHVSSSMGADPFAALGLGPAANPVPAVAPPPPYMPPAQAPAYAPPPYAASPIAAPPPMAMIPEDFNPFELPSAAPRNSADPLSSLLGDAAGASTPHALAQPEQSIDALFAPSSASDSASPFGLISSSSGSSAAEGGFLSGSASSASALFAPADNSDPLAMFGAAADPSHSKPMRDDLAEIGGAYQPPRALDPLFSTPAPAPFFQAAQAQTPAAPSGYGADALTQAFLQGANLPPNALPQGLTPETMAMVGSLLRSAVGGAIDMLAARATIKREVQANVTIISSSANNPLKFLPDADSALQQLLGKKIPGFMRSDEAMRDAFDDLRAHEIGVIAGTRAALHEVLGKFDPAFLGERLSSESLLEKALPSMRKTKLWDVYLERYAQIRLEAEDDFQSIFGKAFVEAYERETARMKANASASRS